MLYEVVMFGGVVFWLLFAILSISILICVENENRRGGAAFFLLLFIVANFLFTDVGRYFVAHPVWTTIELILGFIAGGLLWATPKWLIKLWDLRREFRKFKIDFLRSKTVIGDKLPSSLAEEFQHNLQCEYKLTKYGMDYDMETMRVIPPQMSANRDRILGWMFFWPWDMFWTLFRHPIRWIFESGLELVENTYQKISNALFAGFNDADVPPPVKTESDVSGGKDPN